MESPYYGAPPSPKRRNTTLIVVLILLGVILLLCAGCAGFVFYFLKKSGSFIGCITHYQLALQATKSYANGHDGKLPDAAKWQDEIAPYYQTKGKTSNSIIDFGNADGNLGCAGGPGGPATGMAFNSELSGKKLNAVINEQTPIIFFEVPLKDPNKFKNLHEPFKMLLGKSPQTIMGQPRDWLWIDLYGNLHGSNQNFQSEKRFGTNR